MPKWTDAQQDAIDARGGNILVSGSASVLPIRGTR